MLRKRAERSSVLKRVEGNLLLKRAIWSFLLKSAEESLLLLKKTAEGILALEKRASRNVLLQKAGGNLFLKLAEGCTEVWKELKDVTENSWRKHWKELKKCILKRLYCKQRVDYLTDFYEWKRFLKVVCTCTLWQSWAGPQAGLPFYTCRTRSGSPITCIQLVRVSFDGRKMIKNIVF
jgi:hypothetical protein